MAEHDESPLFLYLEAARQRMLELKPSGDTDWRETVLHGLNEAYANADHLGLAQVVQFLGGLLESDGNPAAAIQEVDMALAACSGHLGASAWLNAMKAAMVASQGQSQAAAAIIDEVAEDAWNALEGATRVKAVALIESVRMMTLQPPSPTVQRLVTEAVATRRPLEQLFVLTWQVPYMAARGTANEARPQVRTALALARGQNATFREADIAPFERWLAITGAAPGHGESQETYFNPFAHFRMACLDVWQAVMHRNWAAAEIGVEAIDRRMKRTGSNTGSTDAWRALIAASARGETPSALAPPGPASLTLGNLGAAMAAAYAVALAGTRPQAQEWSEWTSRLLKRGFESSLETPVSLRRLRGLLAIRDGNASSAGRHLSAAARSCAANGFVTEASLAELQWQELRVRLGFATAETTTIARARLDALGIDPAPHLYAVHNACDAGAAKASAILTPREREVLKQLAIGHTYKQSAATLGTSWKTVQTQAHLIYDKLSVSNRTEAIAEARRLGLL